MKPIDNVLSHLELSFKQNPKLERQLKTKLQKIVLNTYTASINRSDGFGYGSKFKIPNKEVYDLVDDLGYTKEQLSTAFRTQWGYPKTATMYNDAYYHILVTICLYGARHNNDELIKNALTIGLFKIWNGRLSSAIRWCNQSIMKYVIANMLTGKHLTRKYSDPASLIMKYFTPTLMKKYVPMIKADSDRTKLFYMQWYVRINQIFYQNFTPDLNNKGKTKALSGLAVLYYKAAEQGLRSYSQKIDSNIEDDMPSIDSFMTTHSDEELISNITTYITMNYSVNYDNKFKAFLKKESKINEMSINNILRGLHRSDSDIIHDFITIIINILNLKGAAEALSPSFFSIVKQKLISSKHTENIINLKKIAGIILTDILKTYMKINYNDFSDVRQSQLRKSLIYAIAYNIQKYFRK